MTRRRVILISVRVADLTAHVSLSTFDVVDDASTSIASFAIFAAVWLQFQAIFEGMNYDILRTARESTTAILESHGYDDDCGAESLANRGSK